MVSRCFCESTMDKSEYLYACHSVMWPKKIVSFDQGSTFNAQHSNLKQAHIVPLALFQVASFVRCICWPLVLHNGVLGAYIILKAGVLSRESYIPTTRKFLSLSLPSTNTIMEPITDHVIIENPSFWQYYTPSTRGYTESSREVLANVNIFVRPILSFICVLLIN